VGEVGAAPGDDVLGRDRITLGFKGHKGAGALAPQRVGLGDDRGFHHLRVAVEGFLDLER